MIETACIRQAGEPDVEVVADLWTRASQWLRQHGSDQWQYPVRLEGIRGAVHAGTCWVVERNGEVIGTMTLDENPDGYWLPADHPETALYVHRMVVAESARGLDVGSAMLDWACEKAEKAGKAWVRLDAWRSNTRLHQYYRDRGFHFVRMSDRESPSGACFERPATTRLHQGPELHETSTDTPTVPHHKEGDMRKDP